MISRLVNLLAISSLAILLSSVAGVDASPSPVVSLHKRSHANVARSMNARSHLLDNSGLVKKSKSKRATRCRPRNPPTETPPPTSGSPPPPENTPPPSDNNTEPPPNNNTEPPPNNNPPPPPPPPSGGSGGKKLGIAWAMGNDGSLANIASGASFIYTWDSAGPSNLHGLPLMPMLWGGDQGRISNFRNRIKIGFTGDILAFNEPDLGDQSGMSPQQAAQVWVDVIEPYCKAGARCFSPATTSAPSGINWMQQFLDACNGRCSVDVIVVHWYGLDAQQFIQYVMQWMNRFHKPVYVTEYACTDFTPARRPCTQDMANAFHSTVAPWMNGQDGVQGYSPFGFFKQMPGGVDPTNALLDGGGNPTALGRRYITNNWN